MKGTTELKCPVCDSNQLSISNKSFIGDADMICNACGYTFKSSQGKVVAVPNDEPVSTNVDQSRIVGSTPSSPSFDKQLMDLLQQKGKIYAVKFCKDQKGWGLKESKDHVDRLAAQHGIKGKEGCFVATACYGDYDAPEVVVLRAYRDHVLAKHFPGRMFTRVYYFISPPVARLITKSEWLKRIIRNAVIAPLATRLRHRTTE